MLDRRGTTTLRCGGVSTRRQQHPHRHDIPEHTHHEYSRSGEEKMSKSFGPALVGGDIQSPSQVMLCIMTGAITETVLGVK
jgi:hypothetical protein